MRSARPCSLAARLGLALLLAPAAALPAEPRDGGSCVLSEYACADYLPAATAEKACAAHRGAWQAGPCPAERRLGTCLRKEGRRRSFTHSYEPACAQCARRACEGLRGGRWIPPPSGPTGGGMPPP